MPSNTAVLLGIVVIAVLLYMSHFWSYEGNQDKPTILNVVRNVPSNNIFSPFFNQKQK